VEFTAQHLVFEGLFLSQEDLVRQFYPQKILRGSVDTPRFLGPPDVVHAGRKRQFIESCKDFGL